MDNIFSFLFGFPSPHDRHQRPFNEDTIPYREDDHGGEFFGFHGFPFNHDDMFRQMDEAFNRMMKNFGAFDGHVPDQEQGDFQFVPSLPPPPERDVPLRDKMLKQPDNSDRFSHKQDDFFDRFQHHSNFDKSQESCKDSDLDDKVRSGGLGKIFDNPAPELTPAVPKVNRFFRGVSVHTHRDANGRVEERRTVFDDEGEQTTVTRTVDGQTVRQTTIQKKTGDTETVEDLINMDEKDKDNFESKWHSPRSGNPLQILPRNDDTPGSAGDTSIFRRLFSGLSFPGSRKD